MPSLTATLPVKTEQITETRPVVVRAKCNRMLWVCPMAVTSWNRIVSGFKVVRRINAEFNNRPYTTYWQFNFDTKHSLKVTYKSNDETEEGEAYWSKLSDVLVEYDQKPIEGISKVIKHNRLFKKYEIYYHEQVVNLPDAHNWSVFLTRNSKGYLLSFEHEERSNFRDKPKVKLDSVAGIQCAEEFLTRIATPWQIAFAEPISPKAIQSMADRIEKKDPDFALQLSNAFKALNEVK